MFWVQFARSDLRTGARTEARSWFPGKPIRSDEKPRAREFRKIRWTQTAGTPPYYYDSGKLLFRRYIPGPPVPWHATQRCTSDTGLWGGEKHLQQQRQHRYSGLECQSGQLCERAGRFCRSTAVLNAPKQDFWGTFFSFTENKWPGLKGGLVCVTVVRRT